MLQLSHDGHAQIQRIVTVKAGTSQSLPISLESTAPPKGPSVTETLLAAPASTKDTSVVPWVVVSSAAGIAVAGTIFTILAAQESGALDDIRAISDDPGATSGATLGANWEEHVDTLNTYQTVAGVLYGLAGAGLVAGVVLFAIPPPDTPEEASAVPTIHIAPAPDGVVGHASWRF
jgi:hypothetical protein